MCVSVADRRKSCRQPGSRLFRTLPNNRSWTVVRITMREFIQLLRRNRNYRNMWMGQVVSEIGDNFNNIAVFALAMSLTHSGLVIMGIMLSRAIPAITIGPLAGVLLDRFDRKKIMIASDLTRAF